MRFKPMIDPVFAEYVITPDVLQEQIGQSKTASSQADVFRGKIARLKGSVPPSEPQNGFLLFVNRADRSKSVVRQQSAEPETPMKRLMREYFE